MVHRPGGELASRPLQFIWVIDCSGSMAGQKIDSVNFAIREVIPEMRSIAKTNPQAQLLVRAIRFDDQAVWHIPQPIEIENFQWSDMTVDGGTNMGAAMELLAEAMDMKYLPERGLPPVLVLVSDGMPNDLASFQVGLKKLLAQPWGMKAVRIAIAIGEDAETDVLQEFIGRSDFQPLKADNAPTLVKYLKWASTVPVKAASVPQSQPMGGNGPVPNIIIPQPPPPDSPINPNDVF